MHHKLGSSAPASRTRNETRRDKTSSAQQTRSSDGPYKKTDDFGCTTWNTEHQSHASLGGNGMKWWVKAGKTDLTVWSFSIFVPLLACNHALWACWSFEHAREWANDWFHFEIVIKIHLISELRLVTVFTTIHSLIRHGHCVLDVFSNCCAVPSLSHLISGAVAVFGVDRTKSLPGLVFFVF